MILMAVEVRALSLASISVDVARPSLALVGYLGMDTSWYIHAKGVVHITHPFKWHQVELQTNYRYRFLMLHLGGWVKFGTPWMSGEQWATQASKESLVLCDLQYICISSLVPWCLPPLKVESESVKGRNQQTWHQATLQLNHLLASLMAYGATNAQKATQSWTK